MTLKLRLRPARGIGRADDSASSFRLISLYAGRVPGHWELIALAVVVLLLFGSKQVPQIARQLGRGVREVKDTIRDVDVRDDMHRALEAPEDEARAAAPRDD
jgi:TatA/E family protein of Tat protein translocase